MHIQESGEMYLESIYTLSQKLEYVRSIDICEHMGYSKPSVSRAVGLLKQGGYIEVDAQGHITFTEMGIHTAKKIYERHTVLSEFLILIGVDADTAEDDACKMEHSISDQTLERIKEHLKIIKK